MKRLMNFAKLFVGDVSVNLSGGYIGVPQERLDRTDFGAVHK